jgi:hypothetical protein
MDTLQSSEKAPSEQGSYVTFDAFATWAAKRVDAEGTSFQRSRAGGRRAAMTVVATAAAQPAPAILEVCGAGDGRYNGLYREKAGRSGHRFEHVDAPDVQLRTSSMNPAWTFYDGSVLGYYHPTHFPNGRPGDLVTELAGDDCPDEEWLSCGGAEPAPTVSLLAPRGEGGSPQVSDLDGVYEQFLVTAPSSQGAASSPAASSSGDLASPAPSGSAIAAWDSTDEATGGIDALLRYGNTRKAAASSSHRGVGEEAVALHSPSRASRLVRSLVSPPRGRRRGHNTFLLPTESSRQRTALISPPRSSRATRRRPRFNEWGTPTPNTPKIARPGGLGRAALGTHSPDS